MKTIVIRRIVTGSQGTFGAMVFENIPFAVTLEREWLDNQSNISCIPAGEYFCVRTDSPKFGDTFQVANVPGRSHILFHKGNLDDHSEGCILVGESFSEIGNSSGIGDSKHGYNELMNLMSDVDEFRLVIADDWQTPML